MAIHTHTTPSGVNAPALPRSGLLPGNADRPLCLLGSRPELLLDPLLEVARVRHARRALEDALDQGAALLAALGVSPVEHQSPTSIPSPNAAIADAIDLLDRLDAPVEELEDDDTEDDSDLCEDGADAEPSLARPEGHQWEIGGDLDVELPFAAYGSALHAVVEAPCG